MKIKIQVILLLFVSCFLWAESADKSREEVNSPEVQAVEEKTTSLENLYGGIELIPINYDLSSPNKFYQYGVINLGYDDGFIDVFGSFSVCNDDKYQPSHSDDFFLGYYFFMEDGGINLNYQALNLTLGRTTKTDTVDSPYSLFVSSKIIPALLVDLTYDDGNFFFTSRWTELNRNSMMTYPGTSDTWIDRGWQYNAYGLYLGNFRFGVQDSVVYTGTSFDMEYFLNPLPGFFKQYTRISSGKPWFSGSNANSIMGFFGDWSNDEGYAYTQLLIDDLNMNAIIHPDNSPQNPSKIAWSLGGKYNFEWGTLGFYHAGATKYTFQSFGSNSSDSYYGYSFYQSASYTANDVVLPIEPEDSYIGYYNGENNLSFLVDYEANWFDVGMYSFLEFSLSGTKSPANAWSQYNWWAEDEDAGTKLLDSELLEKKLVWVFGASRSLKEIGSWAEQIVVSFSVEAGYVWNALELIDTLAQDVNQAKYWSPSKNNKGVFSVSLGIKYRI